MVLYGSSPDDLHVIGAEGGPVVVRGRLKHRGVTGMSDESTAEGVEDLSYEACIC